MVTKKDMKEMCDAFDEILWMSIRYAHGRHTFASTIVRDACKVRAKHGELTIRSDHTLEERPGPKDRWGVDLESDYLFDLFETYKEDESGVDE